MLSGSSSDGDEVASVTMNIAISGALIAPAITAAMAITMKSPAGMSLHPGKEDAHMTKSAPVSPPAKMVGANSPATPPPELVA